MRVFSTFSALKNLQRISFHIAKHRDCKNIDAKKIQNTQLWSLLNITGVVHAYSEEILNNFSMSGHLT